MGNGRQEGQQDKTTQGISHSQAPLGCCYLGSGWKNLIYLIAGERFEGSDWRE